MKIPSPVCHGIPSACAPLCAQVYMDGPTSHPPVCADVVKTGNYAATLSMEVAVSDGTLTEDEMARWLILNGPLSVALDATGMDYYSDGIDMGEVSLFCWGGRAGAGLG